MALPIPPGELGVLAWRGEQLRSAQQYAQAAVAFDAALELAPDDGWLLARCASVKLQIVARQQRENTVNALDLPALELRYGGLLRTLEQAQARAPDDLWVLSQRIECLRCMKRYRDCRELGSLAIRRDPERPWGYRKRAWAERGLLDFDDALADIERALALDPEHPGSLGYRAVLLGMQGRARDAEAQFEALSRRGVGSAWTLERALIAVFAGEYSAALPLLEASVERRDGYLARYYLLIAQHGLSGSAPSAALERVEGEARRLLSSEAWPIAKLMLAAVAQLRGGAGVEALLLEAIDIDDLMLVEALLCDPLLRPLAEHAQRLRAAVSKRLAHRPQATAKLAPWLSSAHDPTARSARAAGAGGHLAGP